MRKVLLNFLYVKARRRGIHFRQRESCPLSGHHCPIKLLVTHCAWARLSMKGQGNESSACWSTKPKNLSAYIAKLRNYFALNRKFNALAKSRRLRCR
jgi:hypothetical protein